MKKMKFGSSPFSGLYHLTRRKTDWRKRKRHVLSAGVRGKFLCICGSNVGLGCGSGCILGSGADINTSDSKYKKE